MARLPRLCVPGWPHLVRQRGHNGQAVFMDDADRQLFTTLLQESAAQHGLRLHAYGLRDDEVRILATPVGADGLSLTMQAIGRRYVAWFNRRHGRRGALWEGRFRATVIEPVHSLLDCMQYVEVGEGTPASVHEVLAWSSAAHHLGVRADACISDAQAYWALGNTPFDREAAYRLRLERGLTTATVAAIEAAIKSGLPLGDSAFVKALESTTTRRLRALGRGRPRKID